MAAIVTDQFRILNANNFIDSVTSSNNSYYTFLGLVDSSPSSPGFGRTSNWDTNTPSPTDNFQYSCHYRETSLFGKKISSSDVRRVVRRINWTIDTKYDMYRHDYSVDNPTPNGGTSRLYDSNFYVMNSEFKVYICLDNNGSKTGEDAKGQGSQYEPTFTDLEPSSAGVGDDGYIWKYLFTVSPNDIIKFDSTEYIILPNDWSTSTDAQIQSVRESGNSDVNKNQIRKVYIKNAGDDYAFGTHTELNILGDGTGGKVTVTVANTGEITDVIVTAGGSGYTYGIIDLSTIRSDNWGATSDRALLIPIIPPSKGHGYDLYKELGADKVIVYTRFDDSTKDFPTDTNFSQVGIIKNPEQYSSSGSIFSDNTFSSLYSMMLSEDTTVTPTIGEYMYQSISGVGTAQGYVASYDKNTKVLKYTRDRSLYFGNRYDQTDHPNVRSKSTFAEFSQSAGNVTIGSDTVSIQSFTGIAKTVANQEINLGVSFNDGLANPEINRKTGDIIYIDNRPEVVRDIRQKEDVKIILEF